MKSLDRKITSIIDDTNKLSIAKNCYTNTSRNVKYDLSLSTLIYTNFDVLLVSNTNQIKDSIIVEFNSIVVFNNTVLVSKIMDLGFSVKYDKESVVFLIRRENEE